MPADVEAGPAPGEGRRGQGLHRQVRRERPDWLARQRLRPCTAGISATCFAPETPLQLRQYSPTDFQLDFIELPCRGLSPSGHTAREIDPNDLHRGCDGLARRRQRCDFRHSARARRRARDPDRARRPHSFSTNRQVTALRRTCRRRRRARRRWFAGHPCRQNCWLGTLVTTVRRRFDRAEIVVQIFDTPDPVAGAKTDFAAGAGNPAEVISRCHIGDKLADCRRGEKCGVGAVDVFPGEARRAVEQDICIGERDAAADAGSYCAEIFHVVACGVGERDASAEIPNERCGLAADPRCAAIHLKARDPAAELPVVARLSAGDPAR